MKSLEAHVFGSLTTNWWNSLGRIRRWDIVGGDVSLGPSLEASKHLGHSQSLLVSLPSSCRRTCKLSAAPIAMHLLCHHGLQPSETISSKLNLDHRQRTKASVNQDGIFTRTQ